MDFRHHRLSDPTHDRLALSRIDEDFLAGAWENTDSRFLWIRGNQFELRAGRPHWRPTVEGEALSGERVFLGAHGKGHCWAFLDEPLTNADPSELGWVTLRDALLGMADLAVELEEELVEDASAAEGGSVQPPTAVLMHAVGMAEWRLTTRYCGRCGGLLRPQAAGHELVCSGCAQVHFPRTDPAVIMAITYGDRGSPAEQLLLGRQAVWPERRFSTLAGFCEPGESLEAAVRREVAEEVGVPVGDVSYFSNQAWPMPASLMLGFTGQALSNELSLDEREISEARWVTRQELAALTASGELRLPTHFSIARSLIENWYGDRLASTW